MYAHKIWIEDGSMSWGERGAMLGVSPMSWDPDPTLYVMMMAMLLCLALLSVKVDVAATCPT